MACLDRIEQRNDELEEQRTGIPKNRRVSPELQKIFGANAVMAGPDDFERLVGGL